MSRYIDADVMRDEWLYESGTFEPNDVLDSIDCQPTVDAVPVVRCGRCEYYSNEMNCCSYVNGLQNVTKTDYCSYGRCADGERRTDEQLR